MRHATSEKPMHRDEPMRTGPRPRCVYSAELLGGDPEPPILHRCGLYRLCNGRKGRLELLGPEPPEGAVAGPTAVSLPGAAFETDHRGGGRHEPRDCDRGAPVPLTPLARS